MPRRFFEAHLTQEEINEVREFYVGESWKITTKRGNIVSHTVMD